MLAITWLLADDSDSMDIVLACIFLLIVVVGGAFAVIWLRRRYWGAEKDELPPSGFTLGDLRQLHKAGQISQDEFERAKEKIVTAARRAAERGSGNGKPPAAPTTGQGQ